MRRRRWLGSLGWRLLAAFLGVAVSAVLLLALIAAVSVDRRSTALADQQRAQLRSDIASALAAAYTTGRGTWRPEDLTALSALAAAQGLQVIIIDPHQREVARVGTGATVPHDGHDAHTTPPPVTPTSAATRAPQPSSTWSSQDNHHNQPPASTAYVPHEPAPTVHHWTPSSAHESSGSQDQHHLAELPAHAAPAVVTSVPASQTVTPSRGTASTTIPIVVGGRQVGSARFVLPDAAPTPVTAARDALLRRVWVGAALAVLLAAAAALLVSRRMSRPLLALADATRSFAAGDPHPEARLRKAPGELGEVGQAFTHMAASVRQQEELRRAVVADVAHELRTPVTILRGQTEQILDGIAEPTPERIVSLHDEVLRLGRLTDDLATLSAADAAGLNLRTEPVDLGKLARRTTEAMSAHFDDTDLHAHVQADDGVVVRGDPERLAQVLTNLLTNAAKFTPSGGSITVQVNGNNAGALLTVRDTGPGIPADELPHVFERFWRGRAAGQRSGTGVGLAVVNALVQAHGGTISADSQPEGGACFTVQLPTRAAEVGGTDRA